MFGQIFSTIKVLSSLSFFMMVVLTLTADPLTLELDDWPVGNKYVGESLGIVSEKTVFDNLEKIEFLPEDMQNVLLSGKFNSNPDINVRIRRTDPGGYRATLKYNNSKEMYSLDWGVGDLLREAVSGRFINSDESVPTIDFTEHAHWLRLRLHSSGNETGKFVLELDKHTYSWFDLFYFKGDDMVSLFGSYENPMSRRIIQESKIFFPVEPEPGLTDLYMRVESQFFDTVPIRIWTDDEFHRQNNTKKFFHGIVSGVTIILLAYALYLGLSFRERGYLFLAVLILSGYMIHLSESGLGMILLWPENPFGSIFLFSMAMPITILVNLLFCRFKPGSFGQNV